MEFNNHFKGISNLKELRGSKYIESLNKDYDLKIINKKDENNKGESKKNNKEIFTTVVRMKGSKEFNVAPVKSSEAIDKGMWIQISKALTMLRVGPPLKIGDVVCKNILNTGIDIVCTRNISRSQK